MGSNEEEEPVGGRNLSRTGAASRHTKARQERGSNSALRAQAMDAMQRRSGLTRAHTVWGSRLPLACLAWDPLSLHTNQISSTPQAVGATTVLLLQSCKQTAWHAAAAAVDTGKSFLSAVSCCRGSSRHAGWLGVHLQAPLAPCSSTVLPK